MSPIWPSPTMLFEHQPSLSTLLLLVGSLTLAKFLFKTAGMLAETFFIPGTSLKKFGAKSGSWAVVTGASDGIGREFALQLANAGFNIVLVARNKTMLSQVADEITKRCGTKVQSRIVLIDFAKRDETAYENLQSCLSGLDIGVLVNNAGKSLDMPTNFVDVPKQDLEDILAVNIGAVTRVTLIVLPGMKQRKRGLILNIGSFVATIPSPMLATYSASKAFLSTFSDALGEEVKADNIVVQHIHTYFVATKMSAIKRTSALIPSPATHVRSTLAKIGLSGGAFMTNRPHTNTPYWGHALVDYAIHVVDWVGLFVRYTHSLHKDIRRRVLRKREREAKKQ